MKKPYELGVLMMALILSASVVSGELGADEVGIFDIKVEGAWSRASAPEQNTGMADFIITVNGKLDSALVGVSSPVANSVELHSMKTDDTGMMKMREVKSIDLPLGEAFELGLNGLHVMLIDLKKPLKVGDKFPITLTIKMGKQSTRVKASVEVKPLNTAKHGSRDKHRHH
ncbi:MAG: copper chaperone PCu(A)C [Gallionella sp.]